MVVVVERVLHLFYKRFLLSKIYCSLTVVAHPVEFAIKIVCASVGSSSKRNSISAYEDESTETKEHILLFLL